GLPLIPKGSYLVLEGTERDNDASFHGHGIFSFVQEFTGVYIGWQFKSILIGWLRGLFGLCMFLGALVPGAIIVSGRGSLWVAGAWFVIGAAAVILWRLSYRLSGATPGRAIELANRVGVAPEALAIFLPQLAEVHLDIEIENRGLSERDKWTD